MILPPGPIFGDQELRANAWNERPSSRVTGSLWNTVPSITLEHSYFWIALEHKMIHFVLPLAAVDTQNIRFILRRSTLEASRVPKRSLYQKKAPIPDFALTSSLPLSCLLLLPGLGIHCAQLLTNLGFIWEGRSVPAICSNNHLGFIGGNFYLHHHFSFLSTVRTDDPAHSEGSYFSLALAILMLTPAI